MIDYSPPLYRPPSEAYSLIFQSTLGCSHNGCAFCYMYKNRKFSIRDRDALFSEIDEMSLSCPDTRRIFLADGDSMVLSAKRLEEILDRLSAAFPALQRVTAYANPSNLLDKSVKDLRALREKKLSILYYGVETGDAELLAKINKGATPDEMVEGCRKATEAGLKLSVTVILGLGGRKGSMRHARSTADLLNRIGPRYLSALTLMLGEHGDEYASRMGKGFEFNSPEGDVRELREIVSRLTVDRCIFRSNHASNYLALAGTLIKDRERLLAQIDLALESPGDSFRPEWSRGL